MNQICSHPITDCSLHLDKRWRKGWGAGSGMRGRERADGGGGRGDRVNGVNRSRLKFFTGTALDFRRDRNRLSCSRVTDNFRVILSVRRRFIAQSYI